ncbi:MAG: hypothetical protein A2X94_01075 [Bdellovibrionales bacterium GWB1_55_8]|nr:MAG: hypothetical protein A2X94_01075 [Bdellovibrionales bacterium GWB1_55_8]
MKTLQTFLGAAVLISGASAFAGGGSSVGDAVRIPNPSSQNCVQLGGTVQIFNGSAGQAGFCFFGPAAIEEWTLFRATMQREQVQATEAFFLKMPYVGDENPALGYCEYMGGKVETLSSSRRKLHACRFSDNSLIETETLFSGPKRRGYERLGEILNPMAVIHELECFQDPDLRDAGFTLQINYEYSRAANRHVARVQEQSIAGPRDVGTYIVSKKDAQYPGSPLIYQGPDFKITVWVASPREGAYTDAHMTLKAGERTISRSMNCLFPR